VIAGMFFLVRYDDPRRIATGDSYHYMRRALIFTGVDAAEAHTRAAEQVCRDVNRSPLPSNEKPCTRYRTDNISNPRYVAIFDSRPGYPLFGAPFVAVLGPWTGMMAATMLLALLAAALAYLVVRMTTGSRLAGVLASVALFVLPSGFAMTRMLTESGVIAGHFAVLLGATLLLRGRRYGVAVIVAALVWLFAVRSASGMAMALTLLGAGAIALFSREHRRPAGLVMAIGAVGAVSWQAVSAVLGLPGLTETIQDYATRHFVKWRDVPDPIGWLIDKNLEFWPDQLRHELTVPTTVAALAFAVAVLVIRMRLVAALWIFTGLAGVLMVVAHPVATEYDRLMVTVWIPVAAAFGYAAALALGRLPTPATGAQPAPPEPATMVLPRQRRGSGDDEPRDQPAAAGTSR
jgi:hypothetical protein